MVGEVSAVTWGGFSNCVTQFKVEQKSLSVEKLRKLWSFKVSIKSFLCLMQGFVHKWCQVV